MSDNSREERREDRIGLYKELFADLDHPFTGRGFESFLEATDDFIVDLVAEAARASKRREGDVVDSSDVQKASKNLYSGRIGAANHLGTIGGVLLGISGSGFFSWYLSDHASKGAGAVISSALLLLVGAVLVAWNIASDIAQR